MTKRRWLVSIVVLVLLAFWAGRRVDWSRAAAILAGAALAPLAAATAINLASLVLHGMRWWLFLRRIGAPSLRMAVRAAVVGAGLNNLVVAGGGDAARVLLVARASAARKSAVLATVAIDRLFDPICFLLLLVLATFVVPLPRAAAAARPVAVFALAVLFALLVVLARAPARPIPLHTPGRGLRSQLAAFRQSVAGLCSLPRCSAALVLSLGIWASQVATFALSAQAVHLTLPWSAALAALLLTNTGLLLRATPGNVGFFQFAYAVALRPFGVTTETGVAAALLLQLVQIVPVTLAALLMGPAMVQRQSDGVR